MNEITFQAHYASCWCYKSRRQRFLAKIVGFKFRLKISNKYIAVRFRRAAVQECIHEIMSETLVEAEYNTEEIPHWCQEIANGIKNRLKGSKLFLF